jgi:hypothetical protein
VLRSAATSPIVRGAGYACTALCALLFGCAFYAVIWAAFEVDRRSVRVWLFSAGTTLLTLVVAATRYIIGRPHTGGHWLVALVCLTATFACVVILIPLVWVQD